jgi:hypothetical protein
MQFENPMTFVRALKGAPASVLWAFVFTRRVMTAKELQKWTGYKDDNITLATALLVDLGWLVARSTRGPWCLADGRQLPLMSVAEEIVQSFPAELEDENEGKPAVTKRTIPIKSESVVYEIHGVTFEKNWQVCRSCGIGEPKASEISRLPWASPDFIKAHVESLYADQDIGLAIRRIEGNELPRKWREEIRSIPRPEPNTDEDEEMEK